MSQPLATIALVVEGSMQARTRLVWVATCMGT